LASLGFGQRVAVLGGQIHRGYGGAFGDDVGDAQPAEAWPARLDADRWRVGSGSLLGAVEEFAEGLLPARAERGNVDGSA
jgi:hypothetical protein